MSVPWPRGKGARTCSPSDGGTAALSALRPSLPPRGSFPLVKPAACCLPPPWVPVGTVRTASELHSGKISFIQRLYFCIFFFPARQSLNFAVSKEGSEGSPGRAEQSRCTARYEGSWRHLVAAVQTAAAPRSGAALQGRAGQGYRSRRHSSRKERVRGLNLSFPRAFQLVNLPCKASL